ncbi:MAG: transposase [Armatimonadetes bacterium]|nr:transposase [Armatimonadota bacterium]
MENRIGELKNGLQMDRTSCHRFLANQFRGLLHAAAFVLSGALRKALRGTRLATAQVGALQRQLIKLGVRVKQTARKVWLHFASSCPVQDLWPRVFERLCASPA